MDSKVQSPTLSPPESKLAVSQISDLFSLLFSILHRSICSATLMLNTANDQVRTVNHTPVTNLYRRLIVCIRRFRAYLHLIIVTEIELNRLCNAAKENDEGIAVEALHKVVPTFTTPEEFNKKVLVSV